MPHKRTEAKPNKRTHTQDALFRIRKDILWHANKIYNIIEFGSSFVEWFAASFDSVSLRFRSLCFFLSAVVSFNTISKQMSGAFSLPFSSNDNTDARKFMFCYLSNIAHYLFCFDGNSYSFYFHALYAETVCLSVVRIQHSLHLLCECQATESFGILWTSF